LIKLHLAIPEIATLLGISSTSVSKRKLRLKERIVQELGEPLGENKTLDLWLWEY
jgi:DNA-directed RNA polymerase specialized sigma24 family protein